MRKVITFSTQAAVFVAICLAGHATLGSSSSESVFVVYNFNDQSSLAIANFYQDLRSVPSSNLFGLDWRGPVTKISVDDFRKKILVPILKELDRRKLNGQIEHIVYSSGFPYAVNFTGDTKLAKPKFTVGSLTSMTYFFQDVLAKRTSYTGPRSNWYAATGTDSGATQFFSAAKLWHRGGLPAKSAGKRYLLSSMLGYTHGRGNSTAEVIDYLTKAKAADGTAPDGTVYFMTNSDIRTKTRRTQFEPVVEALRGEGVMAEIQSGTLPQGSPQVIGVTTGSTRYDWPLSKSRFLPGAFFDNLTSFGGVLREGASQTPLTEVLKHGVAGACGTVVEPYALAVKFPHASFHLHYARGCCLAEAVYRSVHSPYQLLLVGDPLCQPWVDRPNVLVDISSESGRDDFVSGKVDITPQSLAQDLQFSLFLDGRQIAACGDDERMRFDTTDLPDGHHELRIVAKSAYPTRLLTTEVIPVVFKNEGNALSATLARSNRRGIVIAFKASGKTDGVQAWCRRRLVGVSSETSGKLEIPGEVLGPGPATVQLVAVSKEANSAVCFGHPIQVDRPLTAKVQENPMASPDFR